jgi:hypothetical protein
VGKSKTNGFSFLRKTAIFEGVRGNEKNRDFRIGLVEWREIGWGGLLL